MVRYNANGALDTSFNGTGIVASNGRERAYSVAVQQDGKIVVSGYDKGPLGASHEGLVVRRYNPDGTVDPSLNAFMRSSGDGSRSVLIQPDGKILVIGNTLTIGSFCIVVRFNADGTRDESFMGGDGPSGIGFFSVFSGALQSDGRIIVAGYIDDGSNSDFAVVRYNTDGSPDASFKGTGVVVTPVLNAEDDGLAVAIQMDGRIAVAGSTNNGSDTDFAVVRYMAECLPSSVSGTITDGNAIGSPNPRFVSNVLLSGAGSTTVSALTGFPGGTYSLGGFGAGSYTVTPTKVGGVNGTISSVDAAKIAQHVTGPPSPQLTGNQLIVADVSGNGVITSFDARQVAKFAAGPPYSAPGVGATATWKFNPLNRNYSSIISSIAGEDYSALLMGEVSGNWTNTNARRGPGDQGPVESSFRSDTLAASEGREIGDIVIDAPTVAASAGKEVIIPVSVRGVANKGIISYEFNLRYDPSVIQPDAEPVDVAGTVSRGLSVVTNAAQTGRLRIVVYGPMPIDEEGVLLNVRFATVGASGSVSPLEFERIIFNDGDLNVKVTDGSVELGRDWK